MLNVGLAAGILDTKVFSMFVFMAVVLTVITTPLTLWVYPPRFHQRVRFLSGDADAKRPGNPDGHAETGRQGAVDVTGALEPGGVRIHTSRIMVVLQKMEHLAAIMFLTQLFEQSDPSDSKSSGPAQAPPLLRLPTLAEERGEKDFDSEASHSDNGHGSSGPSRDANDDSLVPTSATLSIEALRLVELTGRTSSVMQSIETDALVNTDDLLQLFKQYGYIRGFNVKPSASVAELDSFPQSVGEHAARSDTQLIVLPWTTPASGASGAVMAEQAAVGLNFGTNAAGNNPQAGVVSGAVPTSPNPFDRIFGPDTNASPFYSVFLRRVLAEAGRDTAVFVDRGFHAGDNAGPRALANTSHHQRLFLPFFGGADDRLALGLVVQMCRQSNVCATVIRFETSATAAASSSNAPSQPASAATSGRIHIRTMSTDSKGGQFEKDVSPGRTHTRTMSMDSKTGQFEKDVQQHQDAMLSGLQTSTTPNFGSVGVSHELCHWWVSTDPPYPVQHF